jgi:glycosyltransferase involved in cell wall biosynthesis
LKASTVFANEIISHVSTCWANMPMLIALRARHPNTPMIHFEHSYSERFVAANVVHRNRFDALMRCSYSLFDTVVAVSEQQRDWMLRRRFCSPQRLAVIEPCVDLKPFLAVQDRQPDGKVVIGAIGRFAPQKGFDILIKGFRDINRSDMELHLYGSGPEERSLRALAEACPNIVFKGYVSQPARAFAACDIVAMPSRYEPYGLVAIEAMAARRPVLCTRVDGLIGHIRAGAIDIGENTAHSWTMALNALDPAALGAFIVRGRAHAEGAESRFSAAWRNLLGQVDRANSEIERAA